MLARVVKADTKPVIIIAAISHNNHDKRMMLMAGFRKAFLHAVQINLRWRWLDFWMCVPIPQIV